MKKTIQEKLNKIYSHDFTNKKKALWSIGLKGFAEVMKNPHYYRDDNRIEKTITKEEAKELLVFHNNKWYPLLQSYFEPTLSYVTIGLIDRKEQYGFNAHHWARVESEKAGTVQEVINILKRKDKIELRVERRNVNYDHSYRGGLSINAIYHSQKELFDRLFRNYHWKDVGEDAKSWCAEPLRVELINYLYKQDYDWDKLEYEPVIDTDYYGYESPSFEGVEVDYTPILKKVIEYLTAKL